MAKRRGLGEWENKNLVSCDPMGGYRHPTSSVQKNFKAVLKVESEKSNHAEI